MTNKPTAPQNYPDVLGAITGGKRQTLDIIDFALATRPWAVNAGKPFDVIVLMQNTSNIEVDALMRVAVPERDLSGQVGRIASKSVKPIRVGLRPGEVGFANLPVTTTALTTPGEGYTVEVEIQVEYKSKTLTRVRDVQHQVEFDTEKINPAMRDAYDAVASLRFESSFSARGGGKAVPAGPNITKAILAVKFAIMPATIAALPTELKPGYTTLWLESDLSLITAPPAVEVSAPVEPPPPQLSPLEALLPKLTRSVVFFPLLRQVQARYEVAGYRLWAGEAVMIAKLLTHIIEQGGPTVLGGYPGPYQPRWYKKLDAIFSRNPDLEEVGHISDFLTEIFNDLVYDASLLAFTILSATTGERFGTPDEINEYATNLIQSLGGGMADLGAAYLPLVLGGLTIHPDVTMPQEDPRETVDLLLRAAEHRLGEQNEQNRFVFEMTDTLVENFLR